MAHFRRADDVLATVSFTYEMCYGPIGRLLARAMEPKAASLITAIFDGWQEEIDRRLDQTTNAETAPDTQSSSQTA